MPGRSSYATGPPKSGNGRRIPLTPEVAQRLRQWPKTVGTKLVFPDPKHGGFRSNSSIRTAFRRARRRGGVEGHARPHDLRHTFASDLGTRNVPPETIRRLGGWASLDMVQRYVHVGDEQLVRAIRGMGSKSYSTSTKK